VQIISSDYNLHKSEAEAFPAPFGSEPARERAQRTASAGLAQTPVAVADRDLCYLIYAYAKNAASDLTREQLHQLAAAMAHEVDHE